MNRQLHIDAVDPPTVIDPAGAQVDDRAPVVPAAGGGTSGFLNSSEEVSADLPQHHQEDVTNERIPQPSVEQACQQAFVDLEVLYGPWHDAWETPDPELAAITLRLLLTHMVNTSNRLQVGMVLDRLDADLEQVMEQLPTEQSVDQD